MMATIKSELLKLKTLRSTYYLVGLAFLIAVFFAFYVEGLKASAASSGLDPNKLAGEVVSAITALATLISIPAILLMTHEYRYNTIGYTLVDSPKRSKVLLAKIVAVSIYSVSFALFLYVLSPSLAWLGMHLAGHPLVPQIFPYWDLLWRAVASTWAYCMLGLILAIIIRAQVGAIVALFLIPSMVESLLGLLLKKNVVYLPFSSIQSIIGKSEVQEIPHTRAALVAGVYIVVGFIVSFWLFTHRDAS